MEDKKRRLLKQTNPIPSEIVQAAMAKHTSQISDIVRMLVEVAVDTHLI